jgi:phosphatidate cytidylyltransferase
LVEKIHEIKLHHFLKLGLMMIGFTFLTWFPFLLFYFPVVGFEFGWLQFLIALIPIAGFILLMIGSDKTKLLTLKTFWSAAFGWAYISLSIGLLMSLFLDRLHFYKNYDPIICFPPPPGFFQFHWSLPVVIIFSLWTNDTMAYIIGSLVGKIPLSKISPKKTWEGTIGGVMLTIVVACVVALLIDFNILRTAITAGIAAIAGTFGDLFESKLKRKAGVKDSGHIMPGHGGFLDRFDSLLFAVPAVWLYVYFILR